MPKRKQERPNGETRPVLPGEGGKRGRPTGARHLQRLRSFEDWGFSLRDLGVFPCILRAMIEDRQKRKQEVVAQIYKNSIEIERLEKNIATAQRAE